MKVYIILALCVTFGSGSQDLDLSGTSMKTFSPDLLKDGQYLEINASNTTMEYVTSSVFQSQTQLITLRMDLNPQLTLRDDRQFLESETLELFSCAGCGFKVIYDKTFSRLPKMRAVNLSANAIDQVRPVAFTRNLNLEVLDLSGNKLDAATNFEELFSNLTRFQRLYLRGNKNLRLREHRAFIESASLEVLDLNGCGLDIIYAESFSKVKNLRQLVLSGNSIKSVDKNAFHGGSTPPVLLASLTFEGNKLRQLDATVVIDSLVELCLDDNEFRLTRSYLTLWDRLQARALINKTANCRNNNETLRFDWLIKTQQLDAGISSAFISTYLVAILVAEGVVVILLIFHLHKLTKRSLAFDYSKTVVNHNQIYKIYKTN